MYIKLRCDIMWWVAQETSPDGWIVDTDEFRLNTGSNEHNKTTK